MTETFNAITRDVIQQTWHVRPCLFVLRLLRFYACIISKTYISKQEKKTKEKLKHVIKNTFYFIFKRFYDIQCIFVFIFFYPRLSKSYHLGGQQRKILVLPKINLAPIYDGVYLEDRVHYYQMSVHRWV